MDSSALRGKQSPSVLQLRHQMPGSHAQHPPPICAKVRQPLLTVMLCPTWPGDSTVVCTRNLSLQLAKSAGNSFCACRGPVHSAATGGHSQGRLNPSPCRPLAALVRQVRLLAGMQPAAAITASAATAFVNPHGMQDLMLASGWCCRFRSCRPTGAWGHTCMMTCTFDVERGSTTPCARTASTG
jgi:hypothetical protein